MQQVSDFCSLETTVCESCNFAFPQLSFGSSWLTDAAENHTALYSKSARIKMTLLLRSRLRIKSSSRAWLFLHRICATLALLFDSLVSFVVVQSLATEQKISAH